MGELPFLTNTTINKHLDVNKETYEELEENIEEIQESRYVEDIVRGGPTKEYIERIRKAFTTVFGDAKFELRKGNSNMDELEYNQDTFHLKSSFQKKSFVSESKILGIALGKRKTPLE